MVIVLRLEVIYYRGREGKEAIVPEPSILIEGSELCSSKKSLKTDLNKSCIDPCSPAMLSSAMSCSHLYTLTLKKILGNLHMDMRMREKQRQYVQVCREQYTCNEGS
jgi:hypothetical protein